MDRSQKTETAASMQKELAASSLVVITQQSGLTVSETLELRRAMRKAGAQFKVLKNTLARIAVQDGPLAGLKDYLKGPTALAYSVDPIAAAKAAVTFAKTNEKLQIIVGCLNGAFLDGNALKALAALPSLDELRGQLLGVLQAPAGKLARTIKEPGAQLVRVLAAKN